MTKAKKVWGNLKVAAVAGLLLPESAWAQAGGSVSLTTIGTQVGAVFTLVCSIVQYLMIMSGMFLGYKWTKGNHEARTSTEHYLIGCVIAFGASSIAKFFVAGGP